MAFLWLIVTALAIYFVNNIANQDISRVNIVRFSILLLPILLQLVFCDFVRIAKILREA